MAKCLKFQEQEQMQPFVHGEAAGERHVKHFLNFVVTLELRLGCLAVLLQIFLVTIFHDKEAVEVTSLCATIAVVLLLTIQLCLFKMIRDEDFTWPRRTLIRLAMASFNGVICTIVCFLLFINACDFTANQDTSNKTRFGGLIFGSWLVVLLIYIYICLSSLFVALASLYLFCESCIPKSGGKK